MKKKKIIFLIIDLVLIVLSVFLDQFTKALAVEKLKDKPATNLIDGVLEFNYLENKGAAFGMLQDQKLFFILVAVVILAVILYVLYKTPDDNKYIALHILLSLIAGGAVGNMIDRLVNTYVVDFIYFKLINFPIFNVADIFVSVGTFVLIILFLFFYKEEDLTFLNFKQIKFRKLG